ncbi:MAG TPA: hypothetical protein VFX70_14775 [Mycobacteriales bacterium]|nr:hypothetical protein [Mycobacteriales bacterium]
MPRAGYIPFMDGPRRSDASMRAPKAHNVLAVGDSVGLIVASDFPATGRTVAGFGDLFAGLTGTYPVWETAPPPLGDQVGMTAQDYLDRWAADVEAAVMPVHAVVGFCVGAVFAAALAERFGAARVVLFDPERPDPDLLLRHYDGVIGGLSAAMLPAEIVAAREAGAAARRATGDMPKLADALCAMLAEHGQPALRRTGLDERRRAELVDTFTSFIAYLVAAAELDPLAVWADATALSSAGPHNGLNPLPPEQRARIVARELRFDVDHTGLLRDGRVIGAVRDLMGER